MKPVRRSQRCGPVVGGSPPAEDTTRQGRVRKARRDVAEMAKVARKELKAPTAKEVQDVGRTKEK